MVFLIVPLIRLRGSLPMRRAPGCKTAPRCGAGPPPCPPRSTRRSPGPSGSLACRLRCSPRGGSLMSRWRNAGGQAEGTGRVLGIFPYSGWHVTNNSGDVFNDVSITVNDFYIYCRHGLIPSQGIWVWGLPTWLLPLRQFHIVPHPPSSRSDESGRRCLGLSCLCCAGG